VSALRVVVVAALAFAATVARADGMEFAPVTITASPANHTAAGVVNLNNAPEDQLTLLPGIGPAKARAIVAYRQAHAFRHVDDVTRVKGIGRKTFGHLRPYLTIVGPSTLKERVKRSR
jgi:comEA protein